MVQQVQSVAEFDEVIKANPTVIIDFTATWCGPCKMIGPKFDEMSKEFTSVKFIKVDVDALSDIAERFGVSAMPTFKVLKNGEKVDELVGASEPKLRELIQKYA